MRLAELVAGIVVAPPPAAVGAQVVRGLARDSRRVRPGEVFVAIPGVHSDGGQYAAEAVRRGALAVVAERDLPGVDVPVLRTPDAARALGLLADRLWGEPSREVAAVGVTGTNGKTTTAFLIAALLEAAGRPCSLLGTVVNRIAGVTTPATMTTPDALDLHAALAQTRAAGHRHLALEVSSHALDQRRVAGVRFGAAAFTNLTRDHLDYHGTLAAYAAAKARLFEELAPDAACALNARDPLSARLAARTAARVTRYACFEPHEGHATGATPPDVWARVREATLRGTCVELSLGGVRREVVLPLVGAFNVENALAAASVAHALGLSPAEVAAGLEAAPPVPGRLERVAGGALQPAVLVDYAHTPDALERVGATLRPLVDRQGGRLLTVFGCGGDRDRGKRAPMARAAERWADQVYVTSDNPRSEDPAAIAAEIAAGLARRDQAVVAVDRAEAIERAIRAAGPQDLVLIAGKGHEQTQVIAGAAHPFDDRDVARAALRRCAITRRSA